MPISSGGTSDAIHEIKMQFLAEDLASKKIELLDAQINKVKTTAVASSNAMVDANKKSTMSITDFRSAYQIAMDVVRVGQQVYAQTINVAQQYDQQVRDMMLSTGGTADETSRLIQVVDDAGVSYGTLKTALKIASREGIEPNIDSLSKLSDEYLKLAPGVERNQFLMQKFGRGGLEMARAMELGGDALRKMSAEMEGGLVLTQDNIDASEEYRKNVDKLNDSVNAFKTSVGNALIPVLNQWVENQDNYNRRLQETIRLYGDNGDRANNMRVLLMQESEERIKAADVVAEHGDKLDGFVKSQDAANESIKRGYDEQFSLIMKISDAYGMSAERHSEMTRKILLDMTLQKIAMQDGEAGFSEAEMNKALAVAETAGAVEAAAIRELVAMEGISNAIANGTIAAKDMKGILESLTTHGWTVQVAIQMQNLQNLRDTLAANAGANPNNTYNAPGRASGGPVSSNQMYMVGERGPELFVPSQNGTIMPNDKSGGMAGVINAIERNRVSEERLVQLFENAVLRVMK